MASIHQTWWPRWGHPLVPAATRLATTCCRRLSKRAWRMRYSAGFSTDARSSAIARRMYRCRPRPVPATGSLMAGSASAMNYVRRACSMSRSSHRSCAPPVTRRCCVPIGAMEHLPDDSRPSSDPAIVDSSSGSRSQRRIDRRRGGNRRLRRGRGLDRRTSHMVENPLAAVALQDLFVPQHGIEHLRAHANVADGADAIARF